MIYISSSCFKSIKKKKLMKKTACGLKLEFIQFEEQLHTYLRNLNSKINIFFINVHEKYFEVISPKLFQIWTTITNSKLTTSQFCTFFFYQHNLFNNFNNKSLFCKLSVSQEFAVRFIIKFHKFMDKISFAYINETQKYFKT